MGLIHAGVSREIELQPCELFLDVRLLLSRGVMGVRLAFSHVCLLYRRIWLGLGGCFNTRSARFVFLGESFKDYEYDHMLTSEHRQGESTELIAHK